MSKLREIIVEWLFANTHFISSLFKTHPSQLMILIHESIIEFSPLRYLLNYITYCSLLCSFAFFIKLRTLIDLKLLCHFPLWSSWLLAFILELWDHWLHSTLLLGLIFTADTPKELEMQSVLMLILFIDCRGSLLDTDILFSQFDWLWKRIKSAINECREDWRKEGNKAVLKWISAFLEVNYHISQIAFIVAVCLS